MKKQLSERRMIENEVYFRQPNEKVARGFTELKSLAEAENRTELLAVIDEPVEFYCECSDENCRKRITLCPEEYLEQHRNSSQFIVLPGHNVVEIERIVESHKKYIVVEKFMTPPATSGSLNKTDVNNT